MSKVYYRGELRNLELATDTTKSKKGYLISLNRDYCTFESCKKDLDHAMRREKCFPITMVITRYEEPFKPKVVFEEQFNILFDWQLYGK